jgi:acyl-CoA thioesterase FadM
MGGEDLFYPLFLGDTIVVRTWIDELLKTGVKVGFEIYRKETNKLASSGLIEYAMINASTGRSHELPAVALERYSV